MTHFAKTMEERSHKIRQDQQKRIKELNDVNYKHNRAMELRSKVIRDVMNRDQKGRQSGLGKKGSRSFANLPRKSLEVKVSKPA